MMSTSFDVIKHEYGFGSQKKMNHKIHLCVGIRD